MSPRGWGHLHPTVAAQGLGSECLRLASPSPKGAEARKPPTALPGVSEMKRKKENHCWELEGH